MIRLLLLPFLLLCVIYFSLFLSNSNYTKINGNDNDNNKTLCCFFFFVCVCVVLVVLSSTLCAAVIFYLSRAPKKGLFFSGYGMYVCKV